MSNNSELHAVTMPTLGMAPDDVVLTEWLKSPGDAVGEGETIALGETAKSEIEIGATASGTLGEQLYAEGAEVAPGAVIAYIAGSESNDAAVPPSTRADPPAEKGSSVTAAAAPRARTADGYLVPHTLSPRQRAAAIQAPSAAGLDHVQPPLPGPTTNSGFPAIDPLRAGVARAVTRSWQEIPQFAVTREIRMAAALSAFRFARAVSSRVSLTDLLLKAWALSLFERTTSLEMSVGLAVAVPNGVMIPTIAAPARVSVVELAELRRGAVERALAGRMDAQDGLPVSTSISNLGSRGVDEFTALVPYGQESILTVGAVADRAVVNGGVLAVEPTMRVTLCVDHRVWDGADAADALGRLDRILQEPTLLATT